MDGVVQCTGILEEDYPNSSAGNIIFPKITTGGVVHWESGY